MINSVSFIQIKWYFQQNSYWNALSWERKKQWRWENAIVCWMLSLTGSTTPENSIYNKIVHCTIVQLYKYSSAEIKRHMFKHMLKTRQLGICHKRKDLERAKAKALLVIVLLGLGWACASSYNWDKTGGEGPLFYACIFIFSACKFIFV